MNIIDHLYIEVLPPPLNTIILDNLTTFSQHQLTQHHNRFPSPSSTKSPTIMNVCHDKETTEPLLNYTLLAIDMPHDAKFHKLYTQAWINVTLALLQRSKNVQIIIDALIYNHTSHCLSARTIIPLDKPIKPASHQALSRILPIDHKFTTTISFSPLTTAIFNLPGHHPCAHDRCCLYRKHS